MLTLASYFLYEQGHSLAPSSRPSAPLPDSSQPARPYLLTKPLAGLQNPRIWPPYSSESARHSEVLGYLCASPGTRYSKALERREHRRCSGERGHVIRPGRSYVPSASTPLLSPDSPNLLSLFRPLRNETANKGAHRAVVSVSSECSGSGCRPQAPAGPRAQSRGCLACPLGAHFVGKKGPAGEASIFKP